MATKTAPDKLMLAKNAIGYFAFLLIFWGFYRLIFQFPEEMEEAILKPLIWILPLLWIVFRKEKNNLESLGITTKNLFPSVYFSFALGAVFVIEGLIGNYLKHGTLNFGANIGDKTLLASFGISLITAISEEISFRGFIFNRLSTAFNSEIIGNLLSTAGWVIIHMPITFFIWKMAPAQAVTYLALTGIFGLGASFVFARTKNVFSSIFLHVLWQWPIILFR
ncbi:CPBP family intramembrane metalloprotease [Candidatus Microgenomates bacterium]|nr:CPBP family intramembrane metalloprotease [Candidatus Microgenomates bacterium]